MTAPGRNGHSSASARGPTRSEILARATAEPLDLLVIGGGIVGAGIARDAAMRGLKTGLVERKDFAFGTSSRSSRLLHGGMRYLAQGRLKLVHEASVEKRIVHHIAPHLAQPLPFIFPTYKEKRNWVLWQLKIGVKIYDLLCGGRNLGKSSWLRPEETLQRVRPLQPAGLQGAVRYFDGFTNDARLVLDTLRSAQNAGAHLLNYCEFKSARRGAEWECDLQDHAAGKSTRIAAHTIVNAAGPWANGFARSKVKLRLTKGIHVVVNRARLPVPDTIVMTEGKRILFAIPWGERTIIGTTDTDYNGPLDEVLAEPQEIRYLLEVTNGFFPTVQLKPADVITSWAGLRPLIADANGKPSDISRSHQIRSPEPGWWDVAGGKLTTYRLMAEQTVNQISHWLKKSSPPHDVILPCRTAEEPLLPAAEVEGISGIIPPRCAREVVEHYCRKEWALHLDDLMLRRAGWHYYLPESAGIAEQVAEWMGEMLEWSAAIRAGELDRYRQIVGHPNQFHAPLLPVGVGA